MIRRAALWGLLGCLAAPAVPAQTGGELRFCLRAEPKTFDPLLVNDKASETIRYLTGGVLIRINRATQRLEPELAESWQVRDGGRRIVFHLRRGLAFSDGTPFTAEDVAHTVRRLMDPKLVSPTADTFRSGPGEVRAEVQAPDRVAILFSAPMAGAERLFDQLAIVPARSRAKDPVGLGPFAVAEYKPGAFVLLKRNPHYWKKDREGRRLPYLDAVRLDIQQNRDIELTRFRRGEIHLVEQLDSELFERLAADLPKAAADAGPSQDNEFLWFNQVAAAPVAGYKKAWFTSKNFRRAVSSAIHRDDIARLAYRGRAQPAAGPFASSNRVWFNEKLKPQPFDEMDARRRLEQDGFRTEGGVLKDGSGHAVEFSLITNAGNKERGRIAALVQQDLAKFGIRLNLVTLDFPSLLDRITRTFDYEACLLGLVNSDLDPNSQMNVWLSSGASHQWNPSQMSPATPWEAEIDGLMRAQAAALDEQKRKKLFDRVQEIVAEEAPFVYLVDKNALAAVSPALENARAVAMRPQVYWNIEWLALKRQ